MKVRGARFPIVSDLRRAYLLAMLARRLVRIRPAAWSEDEWQLSFGVVRRADRAEGLATRWLHERLRELCAAKVS